MKPQPKAPLKKMSKRLTPVQARKRREKMKARARKMGELNSLISNSEKVIREQNKMLKEQKAQIDEQKEKEKGKITNRIKNWVKG